MAAAYHSVASWSLSPASAPDPQCQRASGHAFLRPRVQLGRLGSPERRLKQRECLIAAGRLPKRDRVDSQQRVYRLGIGSNGNGTREHGHEITGLCARAADQGQRIPAHRAVRCDGAETNDSRLEPLAVPRAFGGPGHRLQAFCRLFGSGRVFGCESQVGVGCDLEVARMERCGTRLGPYP